jgi:hypothetical protein
MSFRMSSSRRRRSVAAVRAAGSGFMPLTGLAIRLLYTAGHNRGPVQKACPANPLPTSDKRR